MLFAAGVGEVGSASRKAAVSLVDYQGSAWVQRARKMCTQFWFKHDLEMKAAREKEVKELAPRFLEESRSARAASKKPNWTLEQEAMEVSRSLYNARMQVDRKSAEQEDQAKRQMFEEVAARTRAEAGCDFFPVDAVSFVPAALTSHRMESWKINQVKKYKKIRYLYTLFDHVVFF